MDRPHTWQKEHTSSKNQGLKHVRNEGILPRHVKAQKGITKQLYKACIEY